VFDNEFKVVGQKVVGEQHLKLRLATRDRVLDGIAFRQLQPGENAPSLDRIHAAFQLDINEFRGAKSLQLIIEYMKPAEPSSP
jgi:single-stranded-DNA-specific exonuclease